jgi:uncharacterized protein involved in exopolysaccharide biosynthesis
VLPPPDDPDLPVYDPLAPVRFLRRNARRILSVMALFVGVGVVHALLAPVEYTSAVRFMPELKTRLSGNLSQLSSLAGLAGINLDAGGDADAVRPDLYPGILQSAPFFLHIMRQNIADPVAGDTLPLDAYLERVEGNSVSGRFRQWLRNVGGSSGEAVSGNQALARRQVMVMTRRQELRAEELADRIQAGFDKKTGIITIQVKMPNPVVAAVVARMTTEYLTRYVTSYRTGKARQQAEFLQQRVNEARRRYEAAEYALQNYRDQNRNLFLNVARMSGNRLQADYTLTQTVFNDLSRQLEQAKIKVQEETPVFKELDPPQVPNRRSAPKRTVMVLIYTMLGAIVGTAWAYFRPARRGALTEPGKK